MTITDLEKFIDTYKQFGIEIITYENTKGNIGIDLNGDENTSTQSNKFDGYRGFHSSLEFTKEGKFIKQSFWV